MSLDPQTDEPEKQRFARRPILGLFVLLTLMALIGFAFSAVQLWREARQDALDTLGYINQQLAQSTRATLIKHETILRVVGEEMVRAGALENPERGRAIIEDMHRTDPGMVAFGLVRPDGQLLIASGVPADRPLPNLMDEPQASDSFLEALESHRLVTGHAYRMNLFDAWVIPIRKTIRKQDGEPVAVMAAGYRIGGGTTTWADLELPDDVGVALLREDGFFQYMQFIRGGAVSRERLAEVYGGPTGRPIVELIAAQGGEHGVLDLAKGYSEDNLLIAFRHLPEYELYTLAGIPKTHIVSEFLVDVAPPAALITIYLILASLGYRYAVRTQREHERRLTHLAHHDALTGLPNRTLMRDRLDQAIKAAERDDEHVALLFIDLDHFKEINDTHGHSRGDSMLRVVAKRLQEAVRPDDTVARLGGDEFLILLPGIRQRRVVESVVQRITHKVHQPVTLDHVDHRISTSIGIAFYPDDAEDAEEILRHGDMALFEAKERGRACHAYFDAELNARAQRQKSVRDALNVAISGGELTVVYQPQLSAKAGQVVGVEALLRWENASLGSVSPAEFIPLAEENGLIEELGRFVLHRALRDIQQVNQHCGTRLGLSVNISAQQILGERLSTEVADALAKTDIRGQDLTLELTESVLIRAFENVAEELRTLRSMGVGIAIDDFGTGYSSLSYLNRLPITELKIDRSFVRDIDRDPNDRSLIASIIALGSGQGVRLVAEGVETAEQAALLRELNCHLLQGFHFARPLSVEQLIDYIGYEAGAQA